MIYQFGQLYQKLFQQPALDGRLLATLEDPARIKVVHFSFYLPVSILRNIPLYNNNNNNRDHRGCDFLPFRITDH